MSRSALRALVVVLVPGLCAGQTLSTEAAGQMVRAAGMPLRDGALAPGLLTVRLVEGAFTRNLADQVVELEVAGGRIESARTDSSGRAQFAHLPIGARVRAWATVGGERLESDVFEMASESGMRVLLVAGAGAGAPPSGDAPAAGAWSAGADTALTSNQLPPNHPPVETATTPPPPAPASSGDGVMAIRAVLLTATIFAFGIVLFRRPRPRR